VLQCVAVCCSVLQCVAVCCSVLQCVACSVCVAVCCSVLQCVAVCCSVMHCICQMCIHISRSRVRLLCFCHFAIFQSFDIFYHTNQERLFSYRLSISVNLPHVCHLIYIVTSSKRDLFHTNLIFVSLFYVSVIWYILTYQSKETPFIQTQYFFYFAIFLSFDIYWHGSQKRLLSYRLSVSICIDILIKWDSLHTDEGSLIPFIQMWQKLSVSVTLPYVSVSVTLQYICHPQKLSVSVTLPYVCHLIHIDRSSKGDSLPSDSVFLSLCYISVTLPYFSHLIYIEIVIKRKYFHISSYRLSISVTLPHFCHLVYIDSWSKKHFVHTDSVFFLSLCYISVIWYILTHQSRGTPFIQTQYFCHFAIFLSLFHILVIWFILIDQTRDTPFIQTPCFCRYATFLSSDQYW